MKRMTNRRMAEARKALFETLRCRQIHVGPYPSDYSCFDVQRWAKDNRQQYTEKYFHEVMSGDHLCERCKAVVAILELPKVSLVGIAGTLQCVVGQRTKGS